MVTPVIGTGLYEVVKSITVGADVQGVTITDINIVEENYYILYVIRKDTDHSALYLRFNNDSGANYDYASINGSVNTNQNYIHLRDAQYCVVYIIKNSANGYTYVHYTGTKYNAETAGGQGIYKVNTNITRINLLGSTSDAFGAGSKVILLRLLVWKKWLKSGKTGK